MDDRDDTEALAFMDPRHWESWLAAHHDRTKAVWLLIAKKGSGRASITIDEALDVALCYGWIDSQRKRHDADCYLQRYSPRRPRSPWSKLNVRRAEALIEAGRMRAPGLAEVAAAKEDGRWAAAYGPQRDVELPPDLATALERSARAGAAFGELDKGGRYAIILSLVLATTPAMRADRLRKAIAKLEASR